MNGQAKNGDVDEDIVLTDESPQKQVPQLKQDASSSKFIQSSMDPRTNGQSYICEVDGEMVWKDGLLRKSASTFFQPRTYPRMNGKSYVCEINGEMVWHDESLQQKAPQLEQYTSSSSSSSSSSPQFIESQRTAQKRKVTTLAAAAAAPAESTEQQQPMPPFFFMHVLEKQRDEWKVKYDMAQVEVATVKQDVKSERMNFHTKLALLRQEILRLRAANNDRAKQVQQLISEQNKSSAKSGKDKQVQSDVVQTNEVYSQTSPLPKKKRPLLGRADLQLVEYVPSTKGMRRVAKSSPKR